MLSIHYVSVTMLIFYIDWQQYWKCNWILNICAKVCGKWTVSTKQHQHKLQTRQSGFQWHPRDLYWANFQVGRLFHSVTVSQCGQLFGCYMHLLFETSPFFGVCGWGDSYNVFTIWWQILISRPPRVFQRFLKWSHIALCNGLVSYLSLCRLSSNKVH